MVFTPSATGESVPLIFDCSVSHALLAGVAAASTYPSFVGLTPRLNRHKHELHCEEVLCHLVQGQVQT